jgi:hypothetical protein
VAITVLRGVPMVPTQETFRYVLSPDKRFDARIFTCQIKHFVELFDYTPMEAVQAATTGVADLFMRPHELGRVLPGYYADLILVDGDPLEDIRILQDHQRLNMILINGRIHKKDSASQKVALSPLAWHLNQRLKPFLAQNDGGHPFVVPANATGEGAHAYGRLASLT